MASAPIPPLAETSAQPEDACPPQVPQSLSDLELACTTILHICTPGSLSKKGPPGPCRTSRLKVLVELPLRDAGSDGRCDTPVHQCVWQHCGSGR